MPITFKTYSIGIIFISTELIPMLIKLGICNNFVLVQFNLFFNALENYSSTFVI